MPRRSDTRLALEQLAPASARRAPRLRTSPLPPVPETAVGLPPRERTFHLLVRDGDVASASNYEPVTGELKAVGYRVQVYVDREDLGSVGPELLRDLVTTFDDNVFPTAARTFGQARDVDGDGRFTVLLSSRLTRLAGGKHAVDGFVRGADLDTRCAPPFGNRCDMMYLSTALTPGPYLRTLLAHEYTHAVTFSAKVLNGTRPGREEEGWLDEALAHLAEDVHGFSRANLDYRVSAFLSRPERYRLVVEDYYAADLFRSHGNRGGTYLFLRWCADRFGPGLLPALIRAPERGTANVEAATGVGTSPTCTASGRSPSSSAASTRKPVPSTTFARSRCVVRSTSGSWPDPARPRSRPAARPTSGKRPARAAITRSSPARLRVPSPWK